MKKGIISGFLVTLAHDYRCKYSQLTVSTKKYRKEKPFPRERGLYLRDESAFRNKSSLIRYAIHCALKYSLSITLPC